MPDLVVAGTGLRGTIRYSTDRRVVLRRAILRLNARLCRLNVRRIVHIVNSWAIPGLFQALKVRAHFGAGHRRSRVLRKRDGRGGQCARNQRCIKKSTS